MKKFYISLLALVLSAGHCFAGDKDVDNNGFHDIEFGGTNSNNGVIVGVIAKQADCSTITGGACIDTDNGNMYIWDSDSVELSGVLNWQPLEATLTDIADGTIAENLVNTANPWADDEVADTITASNYLPLAGGTLTGELKIDETGIEGQPTDAITDCSSFAATGGGIFYDDSEGVWKVCQDNVLSNMTPDIETLTFASDGFLGSDTTNWVARYLNTDHFTLTTATWGLKDGGVSAAKLGTDADDDAIEFVIDGGGSAITTGVKGCLEVPWAATISAALVAAPIESGSISVDVWVDSYANFPPTDADSITASAPIAMTTAQTGSSALTGWTVALTKGQWICFNVDSVTSTTLATVSLKVDK